ncbi:GMP synthase-like glutamine amidotransferase [Rhodopseudomonas faecalis]|uniref:GMP synthase-like glutamine amidotransferase n=1 Tax=Rhodopseudomonas faecalis TaxID=99655 RepID=A0A318THZ7_9BRAD|nr:type 1 glutamine amidotransferase [Rhodopseudomonas faecalis]PYF04471.1 GMP synthase-like glutamine amidotransferase [Rhodopseudomonas faecalis]
MRFLVFQHVAIEHPGIFREFWREAGIEWDAVELDEGEPIPELSNYQALVVMGGPMDVWQEAEYPWLVPEKAAIRRFVTELQRPYLGICLGHQLLAAALGGTVGLGRTPEVGLGTVTLSADGLADPLFAGFANPVETFQWHSCEVQHLPPDTVVLAGNEACAVQAMRVGRHAYGVQYHVEITAETVPQWRELPAYAASLDAALGPQRAAKLTDDTAARLPAFAQAARRLNDNFLKLVAAAKTLA